MSTPQKYPRYDATQKKVWTGKFRLSYPAIFAPKKVGDSAKLKYSCAMLIPKTDMETITALVTLRDDTAKAEWGSSVPKAMRNPIKDGDTEFARRVAEGKDGGEEMKGMVVIRCSSTYRPGAVKRNETGKVVNAEETDIYGGCYCMATLTAFAWKHPTNGQGISFNLENILKLEDGEPFGRSPSSPEDDFDAVTDANAAAATPTAVQPNIFG